MEMLACRESLLVSFWYIIVCEKPHSLNLLRYANKQVTVMQFTLYHVVCETDQCTISQMGNITLFFVSLCVTIECILSSYHYFHHSIGQKIYAMEVADRAIGLLLSVLSLSIFTYYTFWVIILPFVETDHFVHMYFLPQEYAILIPVFTGVALICFLTMFIGYVMLKSKKKA